MANLQTPLLDPTTPETAATSETAESHASSSSWDWVHDDLQQLRKDLEEGFKDTRVLDDEPHFFDNVLKVAFHIILTHCCLVLGPAGAGKTSLVKALAPDFEPKVEPGPCHLNRTIEAQGVILKLENLIENLKVVLIDTPGWSEDTTTNVKKEYKKILKEQQLVSEHTPHIILLLIPANGLRQFQDREAQKMSKQSQELKFDQRFPIKVLPVATKADCEEDCRMEGILHDIKTLADRAFRGTGAEVEDPVYTMFPPRGQPDGVAQVKACLSAMLSEQIISPKFGGLWRKAFAKSLADHTMKHCLQFPENDSACRLFKRSYRVVETICKKEAADLSKIASQDALDLPWWRIVEVAEMNAAPWSALGPPVSNHTQYQRVLLSGWVVLGTLTFLSWWEGWHSCHSAVTMLLLFSILVLEIVPYKACLPSWVLQPPRSYWDVRRLRSAILFVFLLFAFSCEHHFSLVQSGTMEQIANTTQQELGMLKKKLKKEKKDLKNEKKDLKNEKKDLKKIMCDFGSSVTGQCYGLVEAPFISSATACKESCCIAGRDCTTWQYQSDSGCFIGKPSSCDDEGSWDGGRRMDG